MIYMVTKQGQRIIILEPANIKNVKLGKPITTPDGETLIAYSPDILWTSDQIRSLMENDELDKEGLITILDIGLTRREIIERPYKHTDWLSGKKEE